MSNFVQTREYILDLIPSVVGDEAQGLIRRVLSCESEDVIKEEVG